MTLFETLHRPFDEVRQEIIKPLGIILCSRQWGQYANALLKIVKELEPNFEINENNKEVLKIMLLYFTGNPLFCSALKAYTNKTFDTKKAPSGSLSKGLCLVGGVGSGKSLLFKAFYLFNQRYLRVNGFKPFETEQIIIDARHHDKQTREYAITRFGYRTQNQINKPYTCYLDDIFKEDHIINDYGTKKDIMGSILNLRYNVFVNCGKVTHATSNVFAKEMQDKGFIDERLADRMSQMFNFVVLEPPKGGSYRKSGNASPNIIKPLTPVEKDNSCKEIGRTILHEAPTHIKCPETGEMVESTISKLKSIPENKGSRRNRPSYEKNYFGKK